MKNNFKIFFIKFISSIFFFVAIIGSAQNIYSEDALTGKGDLELFGNTNRLQKEARIAFFKMQNEALKESVSIQIVSGYRSFNSQKSIWNRKYSKFTSEGFSPEESFRKIIEYSSLPGASRHHWGTEIDIIDAYKIEPRELLIEENYSENGVYSNLKKWMDKNSERFGFYLVYTDYENRKGFKYEPWHYTYAPLSKLMLKEFLKIDLLIFFKTEDVGGNEYFSKDFLNKYLQENVLDINIDLK